MILPHLYGAKVLDTSGVGVGGLSYYPDFLPAILNPQKENVAPIFVLNVFALRYLELMLGIRASLFGSIRCGRIAFTPIVCKHARCFACSIVSLPQELNRVGKLKLVSQ